MASPVTDGRPAVVACVPIHNAGAFLAETLRSLAAQDHPDVHVLMSDDVSSDDSVAIARDFQAASARFQLLVQPRQLGWIANVNFLLERARREARYLFVLPHDDIVAPSYVSRLVAALEGAPEAALAFTDVRHVWCDGPVERRPPPIVASYRQLDGLRSRLERGRIALGYHRDLAQGHYPHVLTAAYRGLFRAEALARVGLMHPNPAGSFGADWGWLLAMALEGQILRLSETLVTKRRYHGSLSRGWRYSLEQQLGEAIGCAQTLRRYPLSLREELLLQAQLLGNEARFLLGRFKG